MGEIAEMMLDGTLCECCGSYIGHGSGYPGYCSRQCAEDRGAAEPRAERPKLAWFRVRDEAALAKLPAFIGKQSVNTINGPRTDRRGDWIIMLGWDDRPDSEWGRFKGNRAAVWFASEALAQAGEVAIRKALGWKVPA